MSAIGRVVLLKVASIRVYELNLHISRRTSDTIDNACMSLKHNFRPEISTIRGQLISMLVILPVALLQTTKSTLERSVFRLGSSILDVFIYLSFNFDKSIHTV